MKTKVILAVLATAVTGFFVGWLIFGFVLASFYKEHTVFYEGLMRDPPRMLGFIVGNLSMAVLIVYIFERWAKITTFLGGLNAGLLITFLIMLCFDMYFWGGMNLFTTGLIIVDVIANTVLGGLLGGVAGWVLGTGKRETPA